MFQEEGTEGAVLLAAGPLSFQHLLQVYGTRVQPESTRGTCQGVWLWATFGEDLPHETSGF